MIHENKISLEIRLFSLNGHNHFFFWTILYPFINKCADNKFYPMILLVGSCLIFKQTGDVVIQSYNNVKFLNGISSMRMHSNFCYKKQS